MTDEPVLMSRCKYGHPERPRKKACPQCNRASQKRYREADPDKIRARQKRWQEQNPERYARTGHNSRIKKQYGITIDDYDQMLEAQGGHCAICPEVAHGSRGRRFLCVDHNHETGAVRGLLCGNCNDGIGRFRESEELLMGAIAYLRLHGDD